MRLALATSTHPNDWLTADDRLIQTTLNVLDEQRKEMKKNGR